MFFDNDDMNLQLIETDLSAKLKHIIIQLITDFDIMNSAFLINKYTGKMNEYIPRIQRGIRFLLQSAMNNYLISSIKSSNPSIIPLSAYPGFNLDERTSNTYFPNDASSGI